MSHRLQILVPEALDARIRQAAQRERVSKGEWVRRVIERALEEKRPSRSPLAGLLSLDAPTADVDSMLEEIERGRRE